MKKKIKAWAVIFPKSGDIYNTLCTYDTIQVKAIFEDKKQAQLWIIKFCKEEAYKPKIKEIEIKIINNKS